MTQLVPLCKHTHECIQEDLGVSGVFAHKSKIPMVAQSVNRVMAMSCEVFWDPFLDKLHYL